MHKSNDILCETRVELIVRWIWDVRFIENMQRWLRVLCDTKQNK